MDKLYYYWLQKISDLEESFNLYTYKIIFKENTPKFVYDLSLNRKEFEEYIKSVNGKLKISLIDKFCSNKLKEKVKLEYDIVEEKNSIISLDNYYSRCDGIKIDIPFCFVVPKNYNFKYPNIYIFFESYFTKFARNITYYFTKILSSQNTNVISEYSNKLLDTYCLEVSNFISSSKFKIIVSQEKYLPFLYFLLIDAIIIIEARYEEKIVNIINGCLDFGKDIYVVPSNIFRKNSYFSNYLIKQGAGVILNKKDVINVIRNICG